MHAFVGCINDVISENIISRNWSSAFLQNGFGRGQFLVSQSLLALLGKSSLAERSIMPTLSQLELCLGRGAQAPAAIIWRRFVHNAVDSSTSECAAHAPRMKRKRVIEHEARILNASRFGRTRSQTAALRDAVHEHR